MAMSLHHQYQYNDQQCKVVEIGGFENEDSDQTELFPQVSIENVQQIQNTGELDNNYYNHINQQNFDNNNNLLDEELSKKQKFFLSLPSQTTHELIQYPVSKDSFLSEPVQKKTSQRWLFYSSHRKSRQNLMLTGNNKSLQNGSSTDRKEKKMKKKGKKLNKVQSSISSMNNQQLEQPQNLNKIEKKNENNNNNNNLIQFEKIDPEIEKKGLVSWVQNEIEEEKQEQECQNNNNCERHGSQLNKNQNAQMESDKFQRMQSKMKISQLLGKVMDKIDQEEQQQKNNSNQQDQ